MSFEINHTNHAVFLFDYKAQNVFWGYHCIHSMYYEMECIETWPNDQMKSHIRSTTTQPLWTTYEIEIDASKSIYIQIYMHI